MKEPEVDNTGEDFIEPSEDCKGEAEEWIERDEKE